MKYYANEQYAGGGLKNDVTIFYRNKGNNFEVIFARDYLDIERSTNDNRPYFEARPINADMAELLTYGKQDLKLEDLKKKGFDFVITYKTSYNHEVKCVFSSKFLNGLTENVRVRAGQGWKHACYILLINIEKCEYCIDRRIDNSYNYVDKAYKTVENVIKVNNSIIIRPETTLQLDKCVYVCRSLTLLNELYFKLSTLRRITPIPYNQSKFITNNYEDRICELMSLEEIRDLEKRYKALKAEKIKKQKAV